MTERLKCAFCGRSWPAWYTHKNGRKRNGYGRLAQHVESAHPQEYAKVYMQANQWSADVLGEPSDLPWLSLREPIEVASQPKEKPAPLPTVQYGTITAMDQAGYAIHQLLTAARLVYGG